MSDPWELVIVYTFVLIGSQLDHVEVRFLGKTDVVVAAEEHLLSLRQADKSGVLKTLVNQCKVRLVVLNLELHIVAHVFVPLIESHIRGKSPTECHCL